MKKVLYYVKSLFSFAFGVKNWAALLRLVGHHPGDEPIQLRLRNGLTFFTSTLMDAWILKETVLERQYERVSTVLQPAWTLVDIGAALGDYAVWAGKQLTRGRLIAVEPFPASVLLLRQNLQVNQLKNVEVVEAAIGAKSGEMTLQLVTGQAVQHSTAAASAGAGSIQVRMLTLAELMRTLKLEKIDYLKIDCEGAEFDILFSSSVDTLQKIERICMEVHNDVTQYNRSDMVRFLETHGFRCRVTVNPVHQHLAYLFATKD